MNSLSMLHAVEHMNSTTTPSNDVTGPRSKQVMKVWIDFVCPFCLLAESLIQKAIEGVQKMQVHPVLLSEWIRIAVLSLLRLGFSVNARRQIGHDIRRIHARL